MKQEACFTCTVLSCRQRSDKAYRVVSDGTLFPLFQRESDVFLGVRCGDAGLLEPGLTLVVGSERMSDPRLAIRSFLLVSFCVRSFSCSWGVRAGPGIASSSVETYQQHQRQAPHLLIRTGLPIVGLTIHSTQRGWLTQVNKGFMVLVPFSNCSMPVGASPSSSSAFFSTTKNKTKQSNAIVSIEL